MQLTKIIYFLLLYAGICAAAAAEQTSQASFTDTTNVAYMDINIDTQEGTWIHVDVSPDGQLLVFDVLGNIYIMPVSGGEAQALTSGSNWDIQPRFSPDGQEIAFISDRKGTSNLWVINLSTRAIRQISNGATDIFSSPVWNPDGEYIAVRKQVSERPVAGAGEIWSFPRTGSDGVQIIPRPKHRKDLGEPAYSSDGSSLYFSEDTTPPFFIASYNGEQIYEIKKLDLESGRILQVVGHAIRPTPSPDGKHLAFVRRDGGHSKLVVRVLKTGKEQTVYDDLDADLQGVWGSLGVYPAMAWMPDNRSVVFWARGKIRSVDIYSGIAKVIPFHIKQTHQVRKVPRFTANPFREFFNVKMLRSVQVSPNGELAAYEALGRIYIKSLSDGSLKAVPAEPGSFQFHPAFSHDGQSIIFAVWNDEQLGTIQVYELANKQLKTILTERGHYAEPRFDPKDEQVVFRKTRQGALTAPGETGIPGIHITSLADGTTRLVSTRGVWPQFSADGTRIYYSSENQGRPRHLGYNFSSVALDGSDRRVHLVSSRATAYRLSPDNSQIVAKSGFHLQLLEFSDSRDAMSLESLCRSEMCQQITEYGAEDFNWAGNDHIFWTLGQNLHHYAIKETPSRQSPKPIGFRERLSIPQGRTVLVGANIVTMEERGVIKNGAILIENNRIAWIGSAEEIKIPKDAYVLDASGTTIIPGLIDVHWHGQFADDSIMPQRNWNLLATLAFGVTTIHDPSHDTGELFATSELVKAGRIIGPHIFGTGSILYGIGSARKAKIRNVADAYGHMTRLKSAGAFSVKSYAQPRRDQRQAIISAAHKLGMRVVIESPTTFTPIMSSIQDGNTGIEHAIPMKNIYEDVLQFWSQTDVAYTPTLTGEYSGLYGNRYWYQKGDVSAHPLLSRYVPAEILEKDEEIQDGQEVGVYAHIASARVVKQLYDRGVAVQLGSHGEREGLGAHWEMWSLVQGGMTPYEALQVATINGARYLGLNADIGSLKSGKVADLVILNSDPLQDIRNSDDIRYVVKNGLVYDVGSMDVVNQ